MADIRKYNTGTTIYFPLIGRGVVDFTTAAVYASGDVKISINGASAVSSINGFNLVANSNGIYSLVLEASECLGKEILISVVDQTNPKVWEDQSINVTTYGNASAELAVDFSTLYATVAQVNAEMVDVITVDTIPELTTITPAVTTLAKMIQLLHMAIRNKNTTTASQNKIHNDAGAVIATAPISDNGTTFTKDEFA